MQSKGQSLTVRDSVLFQAVRIGHAHGLGVAWVTGACPQDVTSPAAWATAHALLISGLRISSGCTPAGRLITSRPSMAGFVMMIANGAGSAVPLAAWLAAAVPLAVGTTCRVGITIGGLPS